MAPAGRSGGGDAGFLGEASGSFGINLLITGQGRWRERAIRIIIPPLLNDFISLQKDTALVGVLGAIEANKAAELFSDTTFNYSSYVVAAILFPAADHPAGPIHRPPDRPRPGSPSGRGWAVMGRTDRGDSSGAETPPAGDAAQALRVEGLRKAFGTNEVLRGIDLSVATHEVICLIGASGSGKSTLLRCVNLLERIDAGTIYLDGQPITGPGMNENLVRRQIGIVFQSFNLFPHMTVERNVTLAPVKVLGLSRAVRSGGKAGRLPGPVVRRAAAAGRHRPGPGDAATAHAARRGDERP